MPRRSLPFLLVLTFLVACGGGDATGTHTDDLGRPVWLEGTPRQVVGLAPNLTELIASASGFDRLAGAALADDFPPEVASMPRFQTLPLDREALVALSPDLVFGTVGVNSPQDLDALADLGLPSYAFEFDALDDVPRVLRTLDTLLGSSRGHLVAEEFETRLAAVRRATAGQAPRRVLLLIGADDGALYAFGRDSYASEIIRFAGGDNATDRFPGDAAQPSVEEVLARPPDVIFLATEGDARAELIDAVPALASLTAVQEGRVYAVEPDLILRPSPRTINVLESIARILHPEAFAAGAA